MRQAIGARGSDAAAFLEKRDWGRNRAMWVRILEQRTGHGVQEWVRRIERARPPDEAALRAWLSARTVTGYAQSLLVMERFGYPDFVHATADELIARQYGDRPALRPIYDAVIAAVQRLGTVTVQARKTYVSLVTPRRTFVRVQAATRTRVDVALRLEGVMPSGRLQRSTIHPTMPVRIGLTSRAELDAEVRGWLRQAYAENS
jgi:hypothetical protein